LRAYLGGGGTVEALGDRLMAAISGGGAGFAGAAGGARAGRWGGIA
jgi:hypothetical protein